MQRKQSGIEVESVAEDIREYFEGNPNAGDTVEGITDWWVSSPKLRNAREIVYNALEYLVVLGELNKRSYGGREIYVQDQNTSKPNQSGF